MRFDTSAIVFWNEDSLFLLKSIPPTGFRLRLPTICWSVLGSSSKEALWIGVIYSCEEKEADDNRDLLCSDSSLCF